MEAEGDGDERYAKCASLWGILGAHVTVRGYGIEGELEAGRSLTALNSIGRGRMD